MKYNFDKTKINAESPIGIFDSGIGGLTIVQEIAKRLPGENVIYIGDDEHFPYGEKTQDEIRQFSRAICQKLLDKGVKLIVIACNTITTAFLEEARATLPVPVVGVVGAGARAAVEATQNKKVGVLATKATVESGMYEAQIKKLDPAIEVTSVAAFKFVEFVENELEMVLSDPQQKVFDAIEEYTRPFIANKVDTIVFGCTHFPPLRDLIASKMPDGIKYVSPGEKTVERINQRLNEVGLFSPTKRNYREAVKSYEIKTTGWDKWKFYDFARLVLKV